jgi:hypothetical protein
VTYSSSKWLERIDRYPEDFATSSAVVHEHREYPRPYQSVESVNAMAISRETANGDALSERRSENESGAGNCGHHLSSCRGRNPDPDPGGGRGRDPGLDHLGRP